jgi:hypothetical protein
MRIIIFVTLAAASAWAQSTCPEVSFQTAVLASLNPGATTHLTFVRQADGSYTAYEVADASLYGIVRTNADAGAQISHCVPRQFAGPPLLPANRGQNAPGAPSQPTIFKQIASGGYLQVQSAGDELYGTLAIDFSIFDSQLRLVSETIYPISAVFGLQFSLADVDGDGKQDLIALASAASGPQGGNLHVSR